MIRLNTNVMGVFALRDGNVVECVFFPDDAKKAAECIQESMDSVLEQEKEIIQRLYETGNREIAVEDPQRFRSADLPEDLKILKDDTPVDDLEIVLQRGVSQKKYMDFLKKVNRLVAKAQVKELEKDQIIMQAVNSLDELEESANLLGERLRELYSYHFPELDKMLSDDYTYAKAVLFTQDNNQQLDQGLENKILQAQKDSMGAGFSPEDKELAFSLARSVKRLQENIQEVESYLEESMQTTAPNITALAGPLLGARLISLAGGLKRLALMPSSTVQVLGAEDAFFRFLKTKKKPPKHGIIFTLPEIRSGSKKNRGKLARTFASKLAIAAKADYFKGDFIGGRLRQEFEQRVKKLK